MKRLISDWNNAPKAPIKILPNADIKMILDQISFKLKQTVYKKRSINKAKPNFTIVEKKNVIGVKIPL